MGKFMTASGNIPPAADEGREFHYSRSDFEAVRTLLISLTGIRLADSKDSMVYSRLVRRIRALGLAGFPQYLEYLQNHAGETENFINTLTTNLTSFFREPHHFDILADFLAERPAVRRIWCAASSTGEEPYSIAMVVAEAFGRFDTPIEIIATDIDSNVLDVASEGIYKADRIRDIPEERRKQFFHRGRGSMTGNVRVVPELRSMVEFRKLNLLDKQWSVDAPIDIIFCRNVMIYFDKPTQLKILERMVGLMSSDGLYFAGHSENFSHATHLVKAAGKTTYRPVKTRGDDVRI